MLERCIKIQELEANPSGCLKEVKSGTTLLLTEGGHRVARLIPEPGAHNSSSDPGKCKSLICGNRKLHTLVVSRSRYASHDVGGSNNEGVGRRCTDGRRGCY